MILSIENDLSTAFRYLQLFYRLVRQEVGSAKIE